MFVFVCHCGMAAGEPAGFGYWIGVLVDSGGLDLKEVVPKEMRSQFRKLARLLVTNEFEHVSQLRGGICLNVSWLCMDDVYLKGSDPSRWIGGANLLQSELDTIRQLVKGGRSRSPVCHKSARSGHVVIMRMCYVYFAAGVGNPSGLT